jgi:hypothetical protein
MTTITTKKLTKAEKYEWARIGDNASVAATYGVFVGSRMVATIRRTQGGGYMEAARWEARATEPMEITSFGRTEIKDNVIVATETTLKAVKVKMAERIDRVLGQMESAK